MTSRGGVDGVPEKMLSRVRARVIFLKIILSVLLRIIWILLPHETLKLPWAMGHVQWHLAHGSFITS